MATAKGDVLVIGGGVIGVCAAYYLAREGVSVTLVDKDDVCAGSSYGNAGLVVPSHSLPLAAPGALASGLQWLLDSESPFYIKPRLDPGLDPAVHGLRLDGPRPGDRDPSVDGLGAHVAPEVFGVDAPVHGPGVEADSGRHRDHEVHLDVVVLHPAVDPILVAGRPAAALGRIRGADPDPAGVLDDVDPGLVGVRATLGLLGRPHGGGPARGGTRLDPPVDP